MKIRVYFICLLVLLAFSGHTGLAQTPRDMTRYDNGGVFDFSWGAGPEAHARMNPKLRGFLWEHWTQKRLAHVVVTLYTIEGDPTTYNLYIEPDRDQRWRVAAEYESECCWFYAMEKPKRKRERKKGIGAKKVKNASKPSEMVRRPCRSSQEETVASRMLTSSGCDTLLTEINCTDG